MTTPNDAQREAVDRRERGLDFKAAEQHDLAKAEFEAAVRAKGDPEAHYHLGLYHEMGIAVDGKDMERAVDHYQYAVAGGHAGAQDALTAIYAAHPEMRDVSLRSGIAEWAVEWRRLDAIESRTPEQNAKMDMYADALTGSLNTSYTAEPRP